MAVALTPYYKLADADDTAEGVALGYHRLHVIAAYTIDATPVYVRFYDSATAPTSASTPVLVIGVPGSATLGGNNIPVPADGIEFKLGLWFRVTTGIAVDNSTGPSASEVIVNLAYR